MWVDFSFKCKLKEAAAKENISVLRFTKLLADDFDLVRRDKNEFRLFKKR